jgi:hypothetical protein
VHHWHGLEWQNPAEALFLIEEIGVAGGDLDRQRPEEFVQEIPHYRALDDILVLTFVMEC